MSYYFKISSMEECQVYFELNNKLFTLLDSYRPIKNLSNTNINYVAKVCNRLVQFFIEKIGRLSCVFREMHIYKNVPLADLYFHTKGTVSPVSQTCLSRCSYVT